MFSIRRIYDATTAANRERLAQVQAILRAQFPQLGEAEIAKLPDQLTNPFKYRFRSVVLVAENGRHGVRGFALMQHAPDLDFCYLDFLSAGRGSTGRGIGGALYQRVRDDAESLGAIGLLFECLPDDPALSPDPRIRAQNAARLRFYERFGARPLANNAYATPLKPGEHDPPYLVFDPLGHDRPLRRQHARAIVEAILRRKYGERLSPEYIAHVVGSFVDDPVRLREPRYTQVSSEPPEALRPRRQRIALVVSDRHQIHHVPERGYVEAPVRIPSILEELKRTDLFEAAPIETFPAKHIEAIHDKGLIRFLKAASESLPPGKSVYPYVFPIRNRARPPKEVPLRAGYYCIDTFTPVNENAYLAAVRAVDSALTAAREILDGRRLAYALVRPPGHHAERASFGGFCYFNSAAAAAHYFSGNGKVAVLDIDYHHGNGTQDIFYDRGDVLTVSIHGHPRYTYPYFSGYDDETGTGAGHGFNVNLPLPESIGADVYLRALDRALARIRKFAPAFLVVSLGLDVVRGDPTGSWMLGAKDLKRNGVLIGELGLPTLVVQEGGYRTRTLGVNARNFFDGLWQGAHH